MVAGPLDGIRVLDFTLAMAGPFATQKLGDMGAAVIKVEPTGEGEWHRYHAAADVWGKVNNASFLAFNRNKRSLSLDLKAEAANAIIEKLVKQSDVVVQNFRPGVATRLGIDYEALRKLNPRIVFCSISGYGETGPYRERTGQDLIVQGMSGATWNIGTRGEPPQPIAVYACDATAAHIAVEGILAALLRRERSGQGQKVEVDLLSGIIDMQAQELSVYFMSGVKNRRTEEPLAHTYIGAPYGIYRTADGYIVLSIGPLPVLGEILGSDRLKAMGEPDAGTVHRDEVSRIVSEILPTKTSVEWLNMLQKRKFWAGPVYDYEDVVADPQVAHNHMVIEIDHPVEGAIRATGIPIRFSETPGTIRYYQPAVGEHSAQILSDLGYSTDEVSQLSAQGVIALATAEEGGLQP